jgi:alkyldihydroxyacetonephosphate synthase
MTDRKLKIVGWGFEGDEISAEEHEMITTRFTERFSGDFEIRKAPTEDSIELHAPRLAIPASLAAFATAEKRDRLVHTYGKSVPDYTRIFDRDFTPAPDIVAFARDEADIEAVYEYASGANVAVIPFGGGSSVCGGVEPAVGGSYNGTISLDLTKLDKILEIDKTSRAARIQGGIRVPAMEAQLKTHGLTLRHFPQSMELATLGGMIATRSGGHYATLYTHIDDFVESTRTVTPVGTMESRRLPGSGAGPSPDRLMIGSEGALGIITEAWMRLQDRPRFRASVSVRFAGDRGFQQGAEAVRVLSQSGLFPANCRLLDPGEAQASGAGDGATAVLVLGFESADHAQDEKLARALECCADAGGVAGTPRSQDASRDAGAQRDDASSAWRQAFLQMPYVRDVLVRMAMISETFETACTWDRFEEFEASVRDAVYDAASRIGGRASVTCRLTHVYPDGPAPYFTVMTPGTRGSELEQWDEIKSAASEAIIRGGGSITHHHAVGRDHRPGYDAQRPEPFARALAAAKRELDPRGILNPGVLIDAPRSS